MSAVLPYKMRAPAVGYLFPSSRRPCPQQPGISLPLSSVEPCSGACAGLLDKTLRAGGPEESLQRLLGGELLVTLLPLAASKSIRPSPFARLSPVTIEGRLTGRLEDKDSSIVCCRSLRKRRQNSVKQPGQQKDAQPGRRGRFSTPDDEKSGLIKGPARYVSACQAVKPSLRVILTNGRAQI